MTTHRARPTRGRTPLRAGTIGLAAAVGLVTGVRAIASLSSGPSGPPLRVDVLPLAELGIRWSERAIWPSEFQTVAAENLTTTIAFLGLACALAAVLNTVVILAEAAAHRRAEYAVRSALGETPRRLWLSLLGEIRALLFSALCLGLIAGVALGTAARMTWPHSLSPYGSGPLSFWDLGLGVCMALLLTIAAHLGAARRATAPGASATALRSGDRVGADPSAIFFRNGVAAFHLSAAGAILIAVITLYGAASVPPIEASVAAERQPAHERIGGAGSIGRVLSTIAVDPPVATALTERIRAIPGIEAESLASPGALIGLGVRDIVVTQCGDCWRGLFPAPLWNELADHHAVGPGYFGLTGIEIVAGRGFLPSDDPDADPVAIVDLSLARTAFEDGEPLGRKLRLGQDYERWYTVVGVVDSGPVSTLGADGEIGHTVWLSALQQPVSHPRVLLAGTPAAVQAAELLVGSAGLDVAVSRPLYDHRVAASAPLRWAAKVALALGVLVALLIGHGLWVTAVQTTARRFREVALRQALGATPRRVQRFVLGERLKTTAWGLAGFAVFGPAAAAAVYAVAGAPVPGLVSYLGVALALTVASTAASARALRDVLHIEPNALLQR